MMKGRGGRDVWQWIFPGKHSSNNVCKLYALPGIQERFPVARDLSIATGTDLDGVSTVNELSIIFVEKNSGSTDSES